MELEALRILLENKARQRLIDLNRWDISQKDVDREIEKAVDNLFKTEETI